MALVSLFLFLDVTFWLLTAGELTGSAGVTKAGGAFGIVSFSIDLRRSVGLMCIDHRFYRFLHGFGGYVDSRHEPLPHSRGRPVSIAQNAVNGVIFEVESKQSEYGNGVAAVRGLFIGY